MQPVPELAETPETSSEYAMLTAEPVRDPLATQHVDLVWRLFTTGKDKLPIVETLSYKSRVPWLKGRPAWVSDYASEYKTSRHFIARSLNGKGTGKQDYDTQNPSLGDRFNVLRVNATLQFRLVIDLSRCKMWFYYHDLDTDERVLLKTYVVGLGRFDPRSPSGLLTPKGSFLLGNRVAVYRPGMYGVFRERQTEMVKVFGTRWLPFSKSVDDAGDSVQGYGFHGMPWYYDEEKQVFREEGAVGNYDSDGCIRLKREDIEELYAIVITRPTVVDIVSDYYDAKLPGKEVEK